MIDRQPFIDECDRLVRDGASLEDVLRWLKVNGASAVDSIRVIEAVMRISTKQAQEALHESPAWAALRREPLAPPTG
jgi:hypothetical protein